MKVEMVNMVMIHNEKTDEVVVQNRLRRWLGWAFPGGGLEAGESLYASAVREAYEETGLRIRNLKLCGIVHWCKKETDARYLCFMYKTSEFSGVLTPRNEEGEYFWMKTEELLNTPVEKFSHEIYFDAWKHFYFAQEKKYSESYIFHEGSGEDLVMLERKYE